MKTEDQVRAEIDAFKKLLKEQGTREEDKPFIRTMIASLQWVVDDTGDILRRLWTVSQIKKSRDQPN